jgi:hypothetical protein
LKAQVALNKEISLIIIIHLSKNKMISIQMILIKETAKIHIKSYDPNKLLIYINHNCYKLLKKNQIILIIHYCKANLNRICILMILWMWALISLKFKIVCYYQVNYFSKNMSYLTQKVFNNQSMTSLMLKMI